MTFSSSEDLSSVAPGALAPPLPDPAVAPAQQPVGRKGILWKWSLGITAVLLLYFLWQCGSTMLQGRKLANAEVRHFHEQLNAERYEEICRGADQGFTAAQSHEELIKFLTAVHKKLGNAGSENQINIRVDTNTNGTFLTTSYTTEFTSGPATETFVWRKSNGSFRLLGYNVQSKALLN